MPTQILFGLFSEVFDIWHRRKKVPTRCRWALPFSVWTDAPYAARSFFLKPIEIVNTRVVQIPRDRLPKRGMARADFQPLLVVRRLPISRGNCEHARVSGFTEASKKIVLWCVPDSYPEVEGILP